MAKRKKKKKDPFKVRKTRAKRSTKTVNTEIQDLALEAQNLLIFLSEAKEAYRRIDEVTEKLVGHDLSEYGLVIKDNFAEKNVKWKSSAFRRFEIERVS